jgi:putative ABC transport system permease protein
VFWGIFMLVLLLGAGRGIENGTYEQFGDLAKNSVFIWGERTQKPYKGFKPGRWIGLNNDDITAIRENIPEAKYIAAQNHSGDSAVTYGNKNGTFTVIGSNPEAIYVETPRLNGRFINVLDCNAKRKVAVIGNQVQVMLFGQEDPIGKYLTIRGVFFQVVGVFEPTGPGSEREAEQIYIPITTMQRLFQWGNYIGYIAIIAEDNIPASIVEEETKTLLKRRHKVAPDDPRGIGSWNAEKEFNQFRGLFRGIRIFIWVVGAGTIVAGIVGVSNVMLIIVKERTREIGIRKALGATPFSIITLILQESIFLTAISGYTGLVVSVGLIELASYAMNVFELQSPYFSNPEIDFAAGISATIILVITGALAVLITARTAAAVNPIEALRSE